MSIVVFVEFVLCNFHMTMGEPGDFTFGFQGVAGDPFCA